MVTLLAALPSRTILSGPAVCDLYKRKYQNGVSFGKVTSGGGVGSGGGGSMAGAAGAEFVEGWLVAQVLGEGAYGEVRLLVHARSGARVALKAVGAEGGREAALHRALRHEHVLRCLGAREHLGAHYLFLEHAAGGELFDRIEPDAGMPPPAARRYWRQLAAGLRYLHARGVAHRDIKPENLLLDDRDNIKISDFGLATVFRHGARERLLSRVCGTVPYAAPDVLTAPQRPYRATPADVWAAAVVLVAMLAGELPWERADESDVRYAAWNAWCSGGGGAGVGVGAPGGVWRRLEGGALRWVRRALWPQAGERARLADLLLERWMSTDGAGAGGGDEGDAVEGRGWASQPAPAPPVQAEASELSPAAMDALLSSSQPADGAELVPAWGGAPRLTRVWLRGAPGEALRAVERALVAARCGVRRVDARTLAADAGPALRLRAWLAGSAGGAALVEFRRWRGCGLQFRRRYAEVRAALDPLAVPPPDVTHPLPLPPLQPPEPMDHDS